NAPAPINKPNQRVQKRISNVAALPRLAELDTRKRVSPNILPSAVPSPPGRPETEPISDDIAKIKVALIKRTTLAGVPSPVQTKYNAPHSPAHEIRPSAVASNNGRHWSNTHELS